MCVSLLMAATLSHSSSVIREQVAINSFAVDVVRQHIVRPSSFEAD